MLVCNSVLQAHGFINLPVVIMALGGVVKIVTNYNLVAVPTIGISGAQWAMCSASDCAWYWTWWSSPG